MPTSNYWDSTYGRGIGGPNAGSGTSNPYGSSSPQSSSYTSYTPPSAGTQAAQQGSTSNMTTDDYVDWAKLVYGVYRDRNPPDPKFKDVPLSPEQKQMYQIYIQSMLNPATVNNASALNQMATQMMGGLSRMKWQSPQTFSGNFGYSGSNMSFTPPVGGTGAQWPSPGGGPMGDTPPSTQPAGSAGVPPGAGGVYGGGHAPLPPAPSGAGGSGMDSFFSKYAGNWNQNEETYEKWLARAAAIAAAAVGVPIPANIIDKGIDAAQWIYRKIVGPKPTPLPPSSRGISDFNTPGTMDDNGAVPLPAPTRGLTDFDPPGTRDEYGNPPVPPPVTAPKPPEYWGGVKTPYWNNPYAGGPAPVFTVPTNRAFGGGRGNRT